MAQFSPTRDNRRQNILDAALTCFVEKGLVATTIEEIRRSAGASIGSLYHHFDSKDDLAAALYVEGLRDYQKGAVAELRAHPGAEEGVKAAVVHHLRWVMGHNELGLLHLFDGRVAFARPTCKRTARSEPSVFQ
jgi:AcrR family transcriptional regulator